MQVDTPADFAKISIGEGNEWLTSRLFVAAATLERIGGVKALVFVERTPATDDHLVAVAPASQVRWALAQGEPWLEAAWVRASLGVFPPHVPLGAGTLPANAAFLPDPREMLDVGPPVIRSRTGGLDPTAACQLVSRFIDSLQKPVGPTPADSGWVVPGGTLQERATWVTREFLARLLPADAFGAWSEAFRDATRARRTRAVLRRKGAYVGLVEANHEFVRLVNRQALLEEIAASLGEEPEEAS